MATPAPAKHSGLLWDTVWGTSELGTSGDWDISTEDETNNVGGMKNQDNLATAIIIALFTNARLPDEMVGRDGFTEQDQHNWHGNTFDVQGDEEEIGSFLFLIERKTLTRATALEAVHYCSLVMNGFIRRGDISSYFIDWEMDKIHNRLNLSISVLITGTGETQVYVAELLTLQ